MLTREMAAHAAIPVPEQTALKRMLDAPLTCVFPDGTLPNFNDSGGETKLNREARYYEIGYRLFHDPRYLVILHHEKRGMEALLWGAESLPEGEPATLTSEILPDVGMATLRVRGTDHTLAIKFGPHGGGHGHFDKLTFVSYANGAHLAVDPGTQAYGAKSHATWDKMTVAHNTISVDEKTQDPSTGKVLEWTPFLTSAKSAYRPGRCIPRFRWSARSCKLRSIRSISRTRARPIPLRAGSIGSTTIWERNTRICRSSHIPNCPTPAVTNT